MADDNGDIETPSSVEEINRRLADIQDRLLALAPDQYAEKYELQLVRDRLRDLARSTEDLDSRRSTPNLRAELEARREELERLQKSMVSSAGMHGGGGLSGAYEGPADGVKLNTEIIAATGADRLAARISRLESILADRGAL